jgi:hypothetical protein
MSIIYDMASGRTQSSPEKSDTTAARDEHIPALAVQEPSSGGSKEQSKTLAFHLISALLRKDGTS